MRQGLKRFFATTSTKNYYEILGLESEASSVDIKKRFIELAKENHPDISPQNVEKFKAINEAYSVLSKDRSKAEYDQIYNSFTSNRRKSPTDPSNKVGPFQNFYNTVG